jgi:hypothetical protein
MVLRAATLAIGLFLFVAQGYTAELSDSQLQLFVKNLGGVAESFERLNSLKVSATSDITQNPGFWDDRGGAGQVVSQVVQTYQGEKFLYDIKMSQNGQAYNDYINSYDGRYYQSFNRLSGTLMLGSKPVRRHLIENEVQPVLMPFYFLLSSLEKDPYAITPLTDFTKPSNWKKLLSQISLGKFEFESFNGKPAIRLEFGRVLDSTTNRNCRYIVYFDPTTGFPSGWERLDDQNAVVLRYSVNTLGRKSITGEQSFLYPKEAKLEYFSGKNLAATTIIKVNSISLNTDFDEQFTIDPAIATTIRDIDHRTTIAVPR